jgi:hypothetical protein
MRVVMTMRMAVAMVAHPTPIPVIIRYTDIIVLGVYHRWWTWVRIVHGLRTSDERKQHEYHERDEKRAEEHSAEHDSLLRKVVLYT